MCHYNDVLGSGGELAVQLLTALTIVAGIAAWVLIYRRMGVGLRQYAVPICLWILFGTLDILITARGTYENPMAEGNPLARAIFSGTEAGAIGWFGPPLASLLWISLWSGLVLAVNVKFANRKMGPVPASIPIVQFVSLAVFYSLAAGHLYGFSSWFVPMCQVARAYSMIPGIPRLAIIIALGCLASAAHLCLRHLASRLVTHFFKSR